MNDSSLQQRRLMAAGVDIAVGLALFLVLWIVLWLGVAIARGALGSDSVIAGYLGRVLTFVAALVGLAYVLGRDLFGGGRSLGKKTQDLRVQTATGAPLSPVDSAKRNALFAGWPALVAISATLRLVPCLGDALACLVDSLFFVGLLATIAAVIVEVVQITQDPAGIRFGDKFARTRVVRA